jgi:hypothetical protein
MLCTKILSRVCAIAVAVILQRHVVVSGKNGYATGAITPLVQKKRMYVLQANIGDGNGCVFDNDEAADPEGGRRTGCTPS